MAHGDLAGRVTADKTLPHLYDPSPNWDRGTLAVPTRIAGVVAGSGKGNASARGAAPNAQIYSYLPYNDYQDKTPRFAEYEVGLHGWRVAAIGSDGRIPCVSGTGCTFNGSWGSYIDDARDEDDWAWSLGVLPVHAVGTKGLFKSSGPGYENANWTTIFSGAVAKNALTVCAAERLPGTPARFLVNPDSAKGPTSDGRLKPEVCGVGRNVRAPDLDGGYADIMSTDGAAAQIAGVAALLEQAYERISGGHDHLSPALARALLVHSAVDIDDRSTYTDGVDAHASTGPDYVTGYGWVDAKTAVDLLQNPTRYFGRIAAQGDVVERDIEVPAHYGLKVTLAWVDPPADVMAARTLINDLDLEVEDLSGGTLHFPWVLDPNQPAKPATTGPNHVDNLEQVVWETGVDAKARIRVRAPKVGLGPQPYWVVYSLFESTRYPATMPPDMGQGPLPSGPLPTIERGCGCAVGGAPPRDGFALLMVTVGVAALLLRRRRERLSRR